MNPYGNFHAPFKESSISISFFLFFFFDQCLFLVRKCSGRRFLNLSCAFPCNFFLFLTSTCSAEICIVMSTSIFEIFRINNMSAARELAIRGKKVSLLCFNISIIRERMKKLSSICSPPVGWYKIVFQGNTWQPYILSCWKINLIARTICSEQGILKPRYAIWKFSPIL